jgi:hypothetical protein
MLDRTIAARGVRNRRFRHGGTPVALEDFLAMASSRMLRAALALLAIACVAGCESQGNPSGVALAAAPPALNDMSAPQPRSATYACADGASVTIENLGSSVRVTDADGGSEELPASPANQNSRYGEAHDAIVLDGREALVMKGGATPLTCTR